MTRPFSVVVPALEVALAISCLLSLCFWGELRSILCAPDGTGALLLPCLRGFSRFAPSDIRESSRKLQVGAAVELLQSFETELGYSRRAQLSSRVTSLA